MFGTVELSTRPETNESLEDVFNHQFENGISRSSLLFGWN